MVRVLFVCTGNICRSPTAEGVFRHLIREARLGQAIESASAGTHGYHVGDPPDPRTIAAARRRGFDLSAQRARKLKAEDFHAFDLILAMDRDHFAYLESLRPNDARAEIGMFLEYHPERPYKDVPDPYYGGPEGFELVLDLIERTSRSLLARISSGLTAR
jgi:protein-tyrosine phosphatase